MPSTTFLLIAARKAGDGHAVARCLDAEALDHVPAGTGLGPAIHRKIGAHFGQARKADVVANAIDQVEAGQLAIFGDEGDAMLHGFGRFAYGYGLAGKLDLAAADGVDAEDAVEDLGPAGSHQAVNAENLPL